MYIIIIIHYYKYYYNILLQILLLGKYYELIVVTVQVVELISIKQLSMLKSADERYRTYNMLKEQNTTNHNSRDRWNMKLETDGI